MLENVTIARPYAEAAFAQAVDENKLTDWSHMLEMLKVVVTDANMRTVISSPKLNSEQLSQFIIDVCGNVLSQTGKNFIKILVVTDRIGLATEIVTLFEQKKAEAEGIRKVDVITAYPLNDVQAKTISEVVAKRFGKQIDLYMTEDKYLIGGLVIRAGDVVIDASLRGRLNELNSVFAQ